MVTIRTTSLTFNNSTFCPHSVFMCFVWISEQTTIISLYNINWLVFITEDCVYCAVRTESLNIIQVNLGSHYAKMKITVKKKHPATHSFCNGGAAHNNRSDTIQSVQNHSSTAWHPTGDLQLIIHLLSAESSQADFEHRHVNGCTCKAYVSTRTW